MWEKDSIKNARGNLKFNGATTWSVNNCNTHIVNRSNKTMEFDQSIEYNTKNAFIKKSCKRKVKANGLHLIFHILR